jgi:hypothetical protein
MKPFYFILLLFLVKFESFSQSISIPKNYSIVDSVSGDLDNDGINELVVTYNTKNKEEEIDEGVPRELIIYKKMNTRWVIWQRSLQALYGSRGGGVMGDPYEGMEIQKGVLSIYHSGGSSWKWSVIDKYRYDGKVFRLIGYENNYGQQNQYWLNVDFNLVTGKLVLKREYENEDNTVYKRENEVFYKKGMNITLQNRNQKQIKIISPKYQHEIYIAMKME